MQQAIGEQGMRQRGEREDEDCGMYRQQALS
jgi:hypothetical protein